MEIGTIHIANTLEVLTTIELRGRGIRYICTDLKGRHCYACTELAMKKLEAQYKVTYEHDDGRIVPVN